MGLKGGYTPTQAATDIALAYLRRAYDERVPDIDTYARTAAERRIIKRAIARLHNHMLDKSKLNGNYIGKETNG